MQLTGKRALAFANLLLFPAMPSSKNNRARAKKTRTRAKKDNTKLQKGKVGERDKRKKALKASILAVRCNESDGRKGTVCVSDDDGNHLINVKVSKWSEISVMINKNDSYADITSKIQFRARALRMPMPSNWELWARVQSVCMFKNLADCEEFAIVPHGGYTNYQHSTLLKPHLQPWARKPRLLNDKGCMKKPSAAHNCELPTIEG